MLSNLLKVIQAETVLCREIAALMEAVFKALSVRDSTEVQRLLQRYQELAAGLAQAEAVRTRIYEQCCELGKIKTTEGMSALISRLDKRIRPAFSTALRDFRMAVYKMRSLSRCIATYTGSQLITLESFMVELVPNRHSGVYGSDGNRASSARPVLVDSLS